MSGPTLDNFFINSTSPLVDSNALDLAHFIGVQGFERKVFDVLDNKKVTIDIILYAARRSGGKTSSELNGIAIAEHLSGLIADDLIKEDDGSVGASEAQVDMFNKLKSINSYPEFCSLVNELGEKQGTLRFQM